MISAKQIIDKQIRQVSAFTILLLALCGFNKYLNAEPKEKIIKNSSNIKMIFCIICITQLDDQICVLVYQ